MEIVDNKITQSQWKLILDAFNTHCKVKGVKEDEPLISDEFTSNSSGDRSKRKQSIFDNYDRYTSPGLIFLVRDNMDSGALFVYSCSEQAHAPINLDQGIEIASNFFNYKGTELSESIVCDHVMR